MRPQMVVWCGVLLGITLIAEGAEPPADDKMPVKPTSVELRLRYDSDTNLLTLKGQRVLQMAAPTRRDPTPQPGELVVRCEDVTGRILGELPIVDPTVLHADWLAEPSRESPGLLTGTQVSQQDAEFVIVVPFDAHLAHVRLLKPRFRPDGALERLEAMGTCPINRGQLQAHLKSGRAETE